MKGKDSHRSIEGDSESEDGNHSKYESDIIKALRDRDMIRGYGELIFDFDHETLLSACFKDSEKE